MRHRSIIAGALLTASLLVVGLAPPAQAARAPAHHAAMTRPAVHATLDAEVTAGWVVYIFLNEGDLKATIFTAGWDGVGASVGALCALAASIPPVAIGCVGLVAAGWSYFKGLFTQAINRGGGIALEFTYGGGYFGYTFARTWS